jgi:hypothetical protein
MASEDNDEVRGADMQNTRTPRPPEKAERSRGRTIAGWILLVVASALSVLTLLVILDYATSDYPGAEAAVGRAVISVAVMASLLAWAAAVLLLRTGRKRQR